jgi:hypothetical protein
VRPDVQGAQLLNEVGRIVALVGSSCSGGIEGRPVPE